MLACLRPGHQQPSPDFSLPCLYNSSVLPAINLDVMASSGSPPQEVPEWTVVYHAPLIFKGRGEFLRLMLEDAETPYVNTDKGMFGPSGSMDAFREVPAGTDSDVDATPSKAPYPAFFPPAIWHRPPGGGEEVFVNQVGACMVYLGDQLGYAPTTSQERARANQIMLNALDYITEGRASFHPVKNQASYKDQKVEGDRVSKQFTEHRMKLFLHHFHNLIMWVEGGPEKPVAGGPSVTYADFALFHVLDATAFQFNNAHYDKAWDKITEELPSLKQYYEWMKNRPNLQSYFQSDRCARK